MARGLSDKQKEILKVVYDIGIVRPVRPVYEEIKKKLYPDFRMRYRYESNIKHTKIRYWQKGEIVDNKEIYKYRRRLATIRASISRAINGLVNRGYLDVISADTKYIYMTEAGKETVNRLRSMEKLSVNGTGNTTNNNQLDNGQ